MAKKLIVKSGFPEEQLEIPQIPFTSTVPAKINTDQSKQVFTIPEPDSSEWTPYVLSLLTDEEKVDNFPLSSGLRRIFTKIHGPITSQIADVLQTPDHTNGNRATVKCTIEFMDRNGFKIVISDASDCFHGNTIKPFSNHPIATASTMAEARCLRKALRLNTMTVEENRAPDEQTLLMEQDTIKAEDNQIFAIQTLCKKLNVDINKTIKLGLNREENAPAITLADLSKNDAGTVMRFINDMRRGKDQGGRNVPEELILTQPKII